MPHFIVAIKVVEHRYFGVDADCEAAAATAATDLDRQGRRPYRENVDSREADLVIEAASSGPAAKPVFRCQSCRCNTHRQFAALSGALQAEEMLDLLNEGDVERLRARLEALARGDAAEPMPSAGARAAAAEAFT